MGQRLNDKLGEANEVLEELLSLRLEARALARSGNPAIRAEGLKGLAEIRENITAIKKMLDDDAEH